MFRNTIKNSVVMSGRNNTCNVNGKTINVPNGAKITVANGKVYVNGKEYKEDGLDKLEVIHLTIKAEGDVRKIDSECEVVVEGNVNGNVYSEVSVNIQGDVNGDIDAGVNANVHGNQTGSVKAGVNVMIANKIYK